MPFTVAFSNGMTTTFLSSEILFNWTCLNLSVLLRKISEFCYLSTSSMSQTEGEQAEEVLLVIY